MTVASRGTYLIRNLKKAVNVAGAWRNPRRRLHAQRILNHLKIHGYKLILTEERYAELQRLLVMQRYHIDTAVDDLFDARRIDLRMAGNTPMIEVLLTVEERDV